MKKIAILICLVLGGYILQAQTYYAVMVLESKNGSPMIGASIKIISTGEMLTTGESGNAVILASPSDSLQIQFKGYKDRRISLVNQSQAISIVMEAQPKIVASKPKKRNH